MDDENKEILQLINFNESLQMKIGHLESNLEKKYIELSNRNDELDEKTKDLNFIKFESNKSSLPSLGDYYIRLENNYLIPTKEYYSKPRWTKEDKVKLMEGIRLELVERTTKDINEKFRSILNISTNSESKLNIIRLVGNLRTKYYGMTLSDLLFENPDENFDWHNITKKYLKEIHSPQECQNMWNLYLHPKFKKIPWSRQEDYKLKQIALKNQNQNWLKIAKDLNTGRSEFQCFSRFHILKKSKLWTKEENVLLNNITEQYRFGSYIHWPSIMAFFPGRSRLELYKRWIMMHDYFRGKKNEKKPFTLAEDLTLLAAARIVGDGFMILSSYLPHRKTTQVRSHWQRLREVNLPQHFSLMDFRDLWIIMKRYSTKNPNRIYKHFHYLKFYQLRSRIRYLQRKCLEKNFKIENLQIPPKKCKQIFFKKLEEARDIARRFPHPNHLYQNISNNLKDLSTTCSTLLNKKKLGRPKTRNHPLTHNFLEFFRMLYIQPPGRAKLNLTHKEYQQLSNSTRIWIQLLNVKLNPDKFPPKKLRMTVDDQLLNDSLDCQKLIPELNFVPPTLPNLVGLRTLLLSQRHIYHNCLPNDSQTKLISSAAIDAKNTLIKRLFTLFLGSMTITKITPQSIIINNTIECQNSHNLKDKNQEINTDNTNKIKRLRRGKKRGIPVAAQIAKQQKYLEKLKNLNGDYPIQKINLKRKYDKTGKYKKEKILNIINEEEIRRSSRTPKKKIYD